MTDVLMPRLSDTMEEGELSKWLKNVGDQVEKGDVLAEIETDKATMDLESFESGVLEKQLVEAGTVVAIGTPVAVIGDGSDTPMDEELDPLVEEPPKAASRNQPDKGSSAEKEPRVDEKDSQAGEKDPTAESEPSAGEKDSPVERAAQAASRNQQPEKPDRRPGRPSALASRQSPEMDSAPSSSARTSPLARKVAKEHGIDLASIAGSGPQGRIVRADVEAAIDAAETSAPSASASSPASSSAPAASDERVPANRLRTVAARRLTESQAVPHFFLTSVVDVAKLLAFRAEANQALEADGVKASVNDVIVRAVAVALRQHPEANASWVDDEDGQAVLRKAHVNVGVAVATDAGLLVPVIRDADRKSLGQIATESDTLAQKARAGKLGPDEMTGGTFSVSNLGMFGIDQFTAVINPPEAAILAVGAATPVPVLRDGELVEVPKLKITLTVDHRVMDGAVAAGFLRDLVGILEQPLRIVL